MTCQQRQPHGADRVGRANAPQGPVRLKTNEDDDDVTVPVSGRQGQAAGIGFSHHAHSLVTPAHPIP
jgi:hypothetical protein